jgi:hypothetical protein
MVIDKATSISLVEILIYMPVYSWQNEPFEQVIASEEEYYHDLGMLAHSHPMLDQAYNGENEARELCELRYKAIAERDKVRGVGLVDVGVHCDCRGSIAVRR